MNIFVVLALAMLLIIVALRKKVPIGPAILAGGLLIWVAVKPEIPLLGEAAKQMFTMQRTYDLLFALYSWCALKSNFARVAASRAWCSTSTT